MRDLPLRPDLRRGAASPAAAAQALISGKSCDEKSRELVPDLSLEARRDRRTPLAEPLDRLEQADRRSALPLGRQRRHRLQVSAPAAARPDP
jgi:hypothetical protein